VDPPLSLKALLDAESVRPPAMTPGWFLCVSAVTPQRFDAIPLRQSFIASGAPNL